MVGSIPARDSMSGTLRGSDDTTKVPALQRHSGGGTTGGIGQEECGPV